MPKLSYENKINIYHEKKQGMSTKSLSKKYKIRTCLVDYLISLIDKHGYGVLRTNKNIFHTKYEKQEAIDRVLQNGESAWSVAIEIGLLNYGILQNWIKNYKENGYNIVERKRGRLTMPNIIKKKENETKMKKLKSEFGGFDFETPRDRNGEFEPKTIPKNKRDVSGIEEKNHITLWKRIINL